MQNVSVPNDSPAQVAFIMEGSFMAPYISDGAVVPMDFELPAAGECGVFQYRGETLIRQYCEDSFGTVYLFVLDRSRKELDVTIPAGETVLCLGRILMEKTPPLPLD